MRQIDEIHSYLQTKIVGQEILIRDILLSFLCSGHILILWNPGLWKTTAAKAFAASIDKTFQRIQFTPDLLPWDILGMEIYNQKNHNFEIKQWPLFSQIVLADEINRAGPKVQSALLEVMEESQITLAGNTYDLKGDFMVLATMNQVDHQGTYHLPYAQIDRFLLQSTLGFPTQDQEIDIMKYIPNSEKKNFSINKKKLELDIEKIYVWEVIYQYIKNIIFTTRSNWTCHALVDYPLSPRASIALLQTAKAYSYLQNREEVLPEDVQAVAQSVLSHRISSSFVAQEAWLNSHSIIEKMLQRVKIHTWK